MFASTFARMFSGATGRVFILLCLMYFIEYVDRVNLSVAAPLIKTELGLSNTELGLGLSAFGWCYAVFQVVFGYVGDRIGSRRMLAIGGLLWAAGTAMTGLVGSVSGLVASRMVVGLGEAGSIPNATRAMARWVPRLQRGFAQGFTHSSARLAAAITPPLVVALIPVAGWRGTFVILGAVSLAWTVTWFLYFRDDPREHRGVTTAELAALPPPVDTAPDSGRAPVPWRPLIRRILPVTLVFFCHAYTLWLYLSWLPTFFVADFGIDIKHSAIFSAGVFLAGVVGDTAGGLLTDAWLARTGDLNAARRNVIIAGFGGALVLLGLMFVLHDQTAVALCLALALFCLEMAEGPIWAVPMDVAPGHAAVAGSFVSTAAGVAAVVSPVTFGFIADLSGGNMRVPFLFSIGLLALGIGLSFLIRADRPVEPGRAPGRNARTAGAVA